jgi:hypothetical protein
VYNNTFSSQFAVSERFHCLFSKHLVHPWQLAKGLFGFGVYLNMILE